VFKFIIAALMVLFISSVNAQDVKAVYHITTGVETAAGALNNIQNHLNADPKVKIIVVTNGSGN
jgi:uncharacterized protein